MALNLEVAALQTRRDDTGGETLFTLPMMINKMAIKKIKKTVVKTIIKNRLLSDCQDTIEHSQETIKHCEDTIEHCSQSLLQQKERQVLFTQTAMS